MGRTTAEQSEWTKAERHDLGDGHHLPFFPQKAPPAQLQPKKKILQGDFAVMQGD